MADHNTLKHLLDYRHLEPFLRHVRFPSYKNLEPGLRLDFTHPISALVGPNGTNKTSILRALQGCRDGQSPGRYWFGTELDTIDSQSRPRIIHGWIAPSIGQIVEALKERSPRESDPDYWEPAQPKQLDGMEALVDGVGIINSSSRSRDGERSKDRWNAINKPVKYLDFRSELSAFDKFFYHDTSRPNLRAKRRSVRAIAPHLLEALNDQLESRIRYRKERIVEPARSLEPESVDVIGDILGRKYTRIELIRHSFFTLTGTSARLRSAARSYSEAFAGSGEFSVVAIVDAFVNAASNTLFLLDEPEVSLHPGAQRNLMDFMIQQCAVGKHQVVLATHSPTMVEDLPSDAVKVLSINREGRVFLRSQASMPLVAFERIGHRFQTPTVLAEDHVAAEIIRAAIRADSVASVSSVQVRVVPGGAEGLKRAAVDMALAGTTSVAVLLDGDQRLGSAPQESSVGDADLDAAIEDFAGKSISTILRGIAGVSGSAGEDPRRIFIDWWHRYVGFLPGSCCPEDWLAAMAGVAATGKSYWADLTAQELGLDISVESPTSGDILATQRRHIAKLDSDALQSISALVQGRFGSSL